MSKSGRVAAGRVIAITGGGSGIGLSLATCFSAGGFRVAICGRDARKLAAAADTLRRHHPEADCLAFPGDLSVSGVAAEFVTATVATFGRLDVIANNAGGAFLASLHLTTDTQFDETWRCHVRGAFEMMRAAWPHLQESKGVILNISSLAAVDPLPGLTVYGACKAALDALTQSVANEGRADGIAVFSIRPGAVETPLLRSLFPRLSADQAVSPEAVAELAWQLCQPDRRQESGSILTVQRGPAP